MTKLIAGRATARGSTEQEDVPMTTNRKATRAALVLAPLALMALTSFSQLRLQTASRLWVDGTSNVRGFSCTAKGIDAEIPAKSGAVSALIAGEKAVEGVVVRIPAGQIDCGNGTMNEHMYKALKAKANPTIELRVTSYEMARGTDGITGTLDGTLTIGGTTRQVSIDAVGKSTEAGTLQVTGTYPVKMTEYGLKPPTLMLGTMKVNELVKVNFNLLLKE
jgi:polyisoprenoid-binding protein YceI